MNDKLNELIENYRKGDKKQFLIITEKFKPIFLKYTKLLYKDEAEDTLSELYLSLLEAIVGIKYYNDEGQCCIFLTKALQNKYMELYRKSRKKYDHEQLFEADFDICLPCDEYEQVELMEYFKQLLSNYSDTQKEILTSILIDGDNCAEAAAKYHVSRQYANQLKNKFCREVKKNFVA